MDRLIVFDTTLRDGEQAPGFSLRVDEKVQMARQLESLGVDIVEAGFPIASESDAEAVRRVSEALERPVVAALARCAAGDRRRMRRSRPTITIGRSALLMKFDRSSVSASSENT